MSQPRKAKELEEVSSVLRVVREALTADVLYDALELVHGGNTTHGQVALAVTVPTNDPVTSAQVPAVDPVNSTPASVPVHPPAGNPYQKGDKVRTACKGTDVEAEVTAMFENEVQVRTPDGELRWRTVRTVQPVVVLLTPPDPMDAVEPSNSSPRSASKRSRGRKRVRQNRLS